jgi:hypothetical protein
MNQRFCAELSSYLTNEEGMPTNKLRDLNLSSNNIESEGFAKLL